MKIVFHDIKIFCKFYKHPNGDEVNFRSHVSGDLKLVFLINQTTPIATSQDIFTKLFNRAMGHLQLCSSDQQCNQQNVFIPIQRR